MNRLNLACGNQVLEDWINIDLHHTKKGILRDDITKLSKITEPVYLIYCAHALIYIPYEFDNDMFYRWYELLNPKGELVIEEPENKEGWESIKYLRPKEHIIAKLKAVGFIQVEETHRPSWSRHSGGYCIRATKGGV